MKHTFANRLVLYATITCLLVLATAGFAQETNGIVQSPGLSVSFTGSQVYMLTLTAIGGSLGTLGLLLGIDRILLAFCRREALQDKRYSADSVVKILPLVIYGITIILVVLTVLLLGLLRIVSAEGALGILGSIVGYVLGKSSLSSRQSQDKETQDA
jgi:hypothetical protein